MHRIIEWLFRFTTYAYIKRKYPEAQKLRFNGVFINITGGGVFLCGENSYISHFSRMHIEEGTTLSLGDNVSIGHNVRVYTSKASSRSIINGERKKILKSNVSIGSNVLIGANVYIGPGVNIAPGVVVGTNSVVVKSIEQSGVYSGNPLARIN